MAEHEREVLLCNTTPTPTPTPKKKKKKENGAKKKNKGDYEDIQQRKTVVVISLYFHHQIHSSSSTPPPHQIIVSTKKSLTRNKRTSKIASNPLFLATSSSSPLKTYFQASMISKDEHVVVDDELIEKKRKSMEESASSPTFQTCTLPQQRQKKPEGKYTKLLNSADNDEDGISQKSNSPLKGRKMDRIHTSSYVENEGDVDEMVEIEHPSIKLPQEQMGFQSNLDEQTNKQKVMDLLHHRGRGGGGKSGDNTQLNSSSPPLRVVSPYFQNRESPLTFKIGKPKR